MSLLIFIIVVIILLALAVYAMQYLPLIGDPFKSIIIVCMFLIAIVVIAQRAGVF